jgi:ADP-dependent NAD(P)H-hydrate dehydratase / NAD(P)H-hydrate epimerase
MDSTYWRRQQPDSPLFGDITWSRPESKLHAGKLTIIGGNAHGFGAPGAAYNEALEAGIGVCKVLLPDAVKKTVKYVLPDAKYGPSNPSGSFSKQALTDFLEAANWADGTLLAGDMGRNSETAILLERFVQEYNGILVVTQDAADYFKSFPQLLIQRPNTALVISLAQLQKIFINAPLLTPITYGMTLPQLAIALHQFTEKYPLIVSVKHHDTVFVAHDGQVISTPNTDTPWRVRKAARASVYWVQNPSRPLQAITTSLASDSYLPL